MHDFFQIIMLLVQSLYGSTMDYPEIDNADPAQNFQLMIKDYGIDLRPKPFDPKLQEDIPKNRVIASSKAPEKKYTTKPDRFSDSSLQSEGREIDLNRITQTFNSMITKTK